jgi:hypothetical protein
MNMAHDFMIYRILINSGIEYDGNWKDDVFEGRGTLYGKGCDWIKYEGDFRAGKMDGYLH